MQEDCKKAFERVHSIAVKWRNGLLVDISFFVSAAHLDGKASLRCFQ